MEEDDCVIEVGVSGKFIGMGSGSSIIQDLAVECLEGIVTVTIGITVDELATGFVRFSSCGIPTSGSLWLQHLLYLFLWRDSVKDKEFTRDANISSLS